MTQVRTPIGPYERLSAEVHEWDPRTADVAARVAELVASAAPTSSSSTSAARRSRACPARASSTSRSRPTRGHPGRRGDALRARLRPAARARPVAADPADAGRLVSSSTATQFRIHLHVQPSGGDFPRDLAFRDALRNDPELRRQYAELKLGITSGGAVEGFRYTHSKTAWILRRLPPARLRAAARSRRPRRSASSAAASSAGCSALAARAMGYRDRGPRSRSRRARPRPSPTALEVGPATTTSAAALRHGRRLRGRDLRAGARRRRGRGGARRRIVPVRPGRVPAASSRQDRLAERRFVEANGAASPPWREVARPTTSERRPRELGYAAAAEGRPTGGYDGRGQVRLGERGGRRRRLDGPADRLARRSCRDASWRSRPSSRSSWRAASTASPRPSRSRGTVTTAGSSSSPSSRPASRTRSSERAADLGERPRHRDGPRRDADGRAVPHARRLARRQRARPARPQQRPLDDRGRRRRASSSSTSGRSAACPSDPRRCARRRRRWSTCSATGAAAAGAPRAGDRRGARRSRRAPPPVRQAQRLRASQDGPRDRARLVVDEALARAREAAARIGWAPRPEGSPTEPGEPA